MGRSGSLCAREGDWGAQEQLEVGNWYENQEILGKAILSSVLHALFTAVTPVIPVICSFFFSWAKVPMLFLLAIEWVAAVGSPEPVLCYS